MTARLFNRKIDNLNGLFNGHFIDVKVFYVLKFHTVPCVSFIGEVDVTKAFTYVKETFGSIVTDFFQHAYFDSKDQEVYFSKTVLVLRKKRLIELADNYCHILHPAKDFAWARQVMKDLAQFKAEGGFVPTAQVHVRGFARQAEMN